MDKVKIDNTDKKIIVIALVIGFIKQFFIESGMDIAILFFFMYVSHKYIGTTKHTKEYESYEFRDKEKFDKGRRLFLILIDVYIVIRIILMILSPQSSYVFSEMILLVMIYIPYEKRLEKKYVISTNIIKEKKKFVLVRHKLLISIGLSVFIILSVVTFNTVRKLEEYKNVKYFTYEYKLSNIENKRNLEIELGAHYMMADENEGNAPYFDEFLEQGKDVMEKRILKSYVFGCMMFMLVLCLIEIYPKKSSIDSIAGNIFIICFLILSMLNFNFTVYDDEMELSSYFHEYIS